MYKSEDLMGRILIRFLTHYPFRRRPRPAAALIFYDVAARDLIRRILRLRDRVRTQGRGLRGPLGYLLNDGSVLAAELLRSLPDRPLGHMSFAPFDAQADSVLDIITDVRHPTVKWEFTLDGSPIEEDLTAAFPLRT